MAIDRPITIWSTWRAFTFDSREIPARPLFGALPIARVIPQDAHAMMDYSGGLLCGLAGMFGRTAGAKIGGALLFGSVVSVSALTDYRYSALKLLPIEAHEALDYVWGASCIAAPFVFGYARRDPLVAATHVIAGIGTILASLFTDYRAARGVGHELETGLAGADGISQPMVDVGSAGLVSG